MEEIRAFHKPLKKQDIMDHQLKYEKIRMEKEHDIRNKRKAEILAERQRQEVLPTFMQERNSDAVLDVLRSPGNILGQDAEQAQFAKNKKLRKEKLISYGKYVKEMYWPKVSEKNY